MKRGRYRVPCEVLEFDPALVGRLSADAEQRLKDTIVYSPVSGVISALNVKAGDMVASSTTNTGGGTAIMTVSD
ncbi:MAG: hypothetical protein J6S92_11280, partial [Oscillospiraceae bacterium]|nr:hypothetical protein [Oscillospiraceae bacterium]